MDLNAIHNASEIKCETRARVVRLEGALYSVALWVGSTYKNTSKRGGVGCVLLIKLYFELGIIGSSILRSMIAKSKG